MVQDYHAENLKLAVLAEVGYKACCKVLIGALISFHVADKFYLFCDSKPHRCPLYTRHKEGPASCKLGLNHSTDDTLTRNPAVTVYSYKSTESH